MPARLRDIARVAALYGVTVTPGARHFHARDEHGRVYPIPAHNGLKTEISDVYLRKFCQAFGIDYAEFRRQL